MSTYNIYDLFFKRSFQLSVSDLSVIKEKKKKKNKPESLGRCNFVKPECMGCFLLVDALNDYNKLCCREFFSEKKSAC